MMVVGLLRVEYAEKKGQWTLGMNFDILKREDAHEIEEGAVKAIESVILDVTKRVSEEQGIAFTIRHHKGSDDAAAKEPP